MKCAHFIAGDEPDIQCIFFKMAAQAHTLTGDVFTGGEFGVADIERLRVAFLSNRVKEVTQSVETNHIFYFVGRPKTEDR